MFKDGGKELCHLTLTCGECCNVALDTFTSPVVCGRARKKVSSTSRVTGKYLFYVYGTSVGTCETLSVQQCIAILVTSSCHLQQSDLICSRKEIPAEFKLKSTSSAGPARTGKKCRK